MPYLSSVFQRANKAQSHKPFQIDKQDIERTVAFSGFLNKLSCNKKIMLSIQPNTMSIPNTMYTATPFSKTTL